MQFLFSESNKDADENANDKDAAAESDAESDKGNNKDDDDDEQDARSDKEDNGGSERGDNDDSDSDNDETGGGQDDNNQTTGDKDDSDEKTGGGDTTVIIDTISEAAQDASDAGAVIVDTCGNDFRRAFDMFDLDGSGKISAAEFGTVMRSLGQNPTDEEVDNMLKVTSFKTI